MAKVPVNSSLIKWLGFAERGETPCLTPVAPPTVWRRAHLKEKKPRINYYSPVWPLFIPPMYLPPLAARLLSSVPVSLVLSFRHARRAPLREESPVYVARARARVYVLIADRYTSDSDNRSARISVTRFCLETSRFSPSPPPLPVAISRFQPQVGLFSPRPYTRISISR